jgi:hypothetical protein
MKFLLAAYFAIFLFLLSGSLLQAQSIVVNEILSSNSDIITDEDDDFEDWIELYNYGSEPVDLSGFYLSDNEKNTLRWKFPKVVIPAKGYLLVWASGKDKASGELHTNFKISQTGEPVILSNQQGEVIDFVPAVQIKRDFSYGRVKDGDKQWVFFGHPTPGYANQSSAGGMKADNVVGFSKPAGFYNQTFFLQLSVDLADAQIYYTTNGDEPTQKAKLYTGPIEIKDRTSEPNGISMIKNVSNIYMEPIGLVDKATVIRAKAITTQGLETATFTHTFFVGENMESRFDLPVVSIATDYKNLFSNETGIYVFGNSGSNFNRRGRAWERLANFEFFENKGQADLNLQVGIRIHGNFTRAFPQKSLRIYTRKEYGAQAIQYPMLNHYKEHGTDRTIQHFERILLRNSGNDFRFSHFRDGFMQHLLKGTGLDTQDFKSAAVFINGEYWGILNFRNYYGNDYFEQKYGIDSDQLTVIENGNFVDIGGGNDISIYRNLVDQVVNGDITNKQKYDEVKKLMDTRNYIDYNVGQIFFRNTDWPHNNVKCWRKKVAVNDERHHSHDGRWRWLVYDTDHGFGVFDSQVNPPMHNTLTWAMGTSTEGNPPASSTVFFRSLLKNEEFKNEFINRFADLLNENFRTERVLHQIDSFQTMLSNEMPYHLDRWGFTFEYNDKIDRMRDFAQRRPAAIKGHIMNYFNLSGMSKVKVKTDAKGSVQVSGVSVKKDYWEGEYFNDIPIKVKAIPKPGYGFVKWKGTNWTDAEIEVVLKSDIELIPEFGKGFNHPKPYILAYGAYTMESWPKDAQAMTYPAHMVFHQTEISDPELETPMSSDWALPYNYTSRSRINGLGAKGVSFINTSNPQEEEHAAYVGGAVLGLNTQGFSKDIRLGFTAGTVTPNNRVYALRLQYKIGKEGVYKDVFDEAGNLVEYQRNEQEGHQRVFENIPLPLDAYNQPEVYLRWKYYYIETGKTGARAELRLDDIKVNIGEGLTERVSVYPNPVRNQLNIEVYLGDYGGKAMYRLFDAKGTKKFEKEMQFRFPMAIAELDLGHWETGMYFLQIIVEDKVHFQKIVKD